MLRNLYLSLCYWLRKKRHRRACLIDKLKLEEAKERKLMWKNLK